MSDEDHGYNSPSQLALDKACPGNVNLRKKLIDVKSDNPVSSPDAYRGIVLHDATTKTITEGEFINTSDYDLNEYDRECLVWVVSKAIGIIKANEGVYLHEQQVDLTSLGISGGKSGCRSDLSIIVPGSHCVIADYKFGVGYVTPPKWNLQFKAYAYGTWLKYGGDFVECYLLQPSAQEEHRRFQEGVFAYDEMEGIAEEIKAIVEATKDPNAPIVKGSQCKFCKAKSICPNWQGSVLCLPRHTTVRAYLAGISPTERAELIENVHSAQSWINAAVKQIEQFGMEGGEVDGYGIIDGKMYREWENFSDLKSQLQYVAAEFGKDRESVVIPERLVSVSEYEKIIGKSKRATAIVGKMIKTVPGKKKFGKVKNENK